MSDADRKKIVFEVLYKNIYSSEVFEPWIILDYDNVDNDKNGYYVPIVKSIDEGCLSGKYKKKILNIIEISNRFPNYHISFSGDADYNLKSIGCEKETHSLYNFSLLPQNGGINRRKGARWGYNEQFGVFIHQIGKYFNIKGNDVERKKFIEEHLLFWGNLKDKYKENVLDFYVAYFDLFDSFDEYCEKVYLVGARTVSEINNIKVDSSNIETTAKKYWDERKRKMSDILVNKVEMQYKNYMDWDLDDDSFI